jgi:hypothetical protein
MKIRSFYVLPLLLAACWLDADEVQDRIAALPDADTDTGVDTDTDDPQGPIVLGGVFPAVGTNAGGTRVEIEAAVLDPRDLEVTFGGVPATIVDAAPDRVVVESPALGVQGAVDIVVSSAGRTVRRSAAYHYWADGTGRASLIGAVENYDVDRPYLSPPKSARSARVVWVEPIDLRWRDLFSDALDTCSRNYQRPGPSVAILRPGVASMRVDEGREPFELHPDAEGEFYGLGPEPGTFPHSVALDIGQDVGGPGWPSLLLEGAVELPVAGFRLTDPPIEFGRASLRERSSITLRWTGGRPGDLVLVRLLRRSDPFDGMAVVDNVTCVLADDGHHIVDSRVWSGWDYGGHIDVYVGRAIERRVRLPFNEAEARVYGIQWWYGELVQGF